MQLSGKLSKVKKCNILLSCVSISLKDIRANTRGDYYYDNTVNFSVNQLLRAALWNNNTYNWLAPENI